MRQQRKVALRAAGVMAAGALTLAACSSGNSANPSKQGVSGASVTLKVLTWEPGTPAYWKDMTKQFEAKHPNIKLDLQSVPFDKYFEVEGPYIQSQSGPDVIEQNAGLELFDRRQAYVPLNSMPGFKTTADQLITYAGGCLDFNASNDCLGLPFSYQGNVMYFNKQVLRQAGLDPSNPPQTWNDFDAACKKIEAIHKSCLALGMQGVFPAYWDFPEIARNFLTESDIRKLAKGGYKWTDPKMVNILRYMAQIPQKGWSNRNAVSLTMLPDGANIFQSGNAGFAGTIISDAVNWQQFGKALGDKNLGVMRWPVINPSAPLAHSFSGTEGSVFGIAKWSKHPKEAWQFISWLAGKENGDLWLKDAQGQPLNRSIDPALMPSSPAFREIQKIIKTPTLHAGIMLSTQETDALSRGWQQIATRSITVDQWAQQMQQALDNSPSKQR